jgi:hypothetical protein
MDLHSAANGEEIGDEDTATAIIKRTHQAMRKDFAQYRELMNESAAQRAAVAQDVCMLFELHFAMTRDVFYPAMDSAELVRELLDAQEDVGECIDILRATPVPAEPELDSTMLRLMELADFYICKERRLVSAADADSRRDLRALGARMIERREKIAGAVKDLEARS